MVDYTTGIQSLYGENLMLKDSHLAALNFSQLSDTFNSIPAHKFLYYVRFVTSSSNNTTQINNNSYISMMVKNITRPSLTFDTKTLNQYNKHRIVQTRTNFDPITINFHDTVDNRILQMFKDYYVHYYKDSLNDSLTWYDDIINEKFNKGNGWGFEPNFTSTNDGHYFDRIEIFKLYGGYYTQMSCIHPIITRLSMDNFDYADSAGISQITMTLSYEGITFDEQNPILIPVDLINEMGLNKSGYYEPYNESPVTSMGYDSYSSDDLYGDPSLNLGGQLANLTGGALQTILDEAVSEQKVKIGAAFKGSLLRTIGNNINNTNGLLYDGLGGLLGGQSVKEILSKYGYNVANSGIINTVHTSLNNGGGLSNRGLNLYTGIKNNNG